MDGIKLLMVYLYFMGIVTFAGAIKRCFECRSRGALGDCGDPFQVNASTPTSGVTVITCVSGWCGKILEGNDDTIRRTERLCIPSPPSDNEERCADTLWASKKVTMCFCDGDLCNRGSTNPLSSYYTITIFITISTILKFLFTV